MRTIFKYPLTHPRTVVELPVGAEVISAAAQKETVCIWVVVDSSAKTEERTFEVFMTGEGVPDCQNDEERVFVSTVFIDWIVGHVFEKKTKSHE